MKIYTKKGDLGETSLFGGTRLPKHHLRIEAYGTVDELNSWLGMLASTQEGLAYLPQIQSIQNHLFVLGSHLAAAPGKEHPHLPAWPGTAVQELETWIDRMDEGLEPLKTFILPGGASSASQAHVARCVCRRAERLCTALNEQEGLAPELLAFLNRLSDYLFTLARQFNADAGREDVPWHP